MPKLNSILQANVSEEAAFHQHHLLGNSTSIENGTVYLYNRNFQKNKRAAIQAYRDGNPSNKILIQAIVVSTGNKGILQHVCELKYPV